MGVEILLGAVCVLVAITFIGHGIWVFLGMLFGDGEQAPLPLPAGFKRSTCPRCHLPLEAATCPACHWPAPLGAHSADPQAALVALANQVIGLSHAGVLDGEACEHFLRVVAEERERLMAAAAPPPVEPAAAAAANEDFVVAEVVAEVVPEPAPVAPAPGSPAQPVEHIPTPSVRDRVEEILARTQPQPRGHQRAAAAPPPPPAPEIPKATWGDWFSGFMEESNIRWGELVGGLLIVGGSIAMVITFWSAIAERPLLKFFLFNGVTAALFALGFYSERRWKLHTTSQGLLLTASLLVPLNFLAIAAYSTTVSLENPWTIPGELVSIALFVGLMVAAGRIMVGRATWMLAVGVLVPSVAQLLVRRFVEPTTETTTLVALAGLPLAAYLISNFWTLRQAATAPELGEPQIDSLFKFLGLTSFSVLLPLGLLLFKTGHPIVALRELPLAVCLLGTVPLAVGMFLWQRLAGVNLTGLRTAGTSIAVFGAFVSLAGVVLGWPDPMSMLPAALLEFVIFTYVAWRLAMPWAHLLAAACLALAYLLGVHLAQHHLVWRGQEPLALVQTLLSGSSGTMLLPLTLFYAGAAYLARRGSSDSAPAFATAATVIGGVSTALVSRGFGVQGDPLGASWVYLVYAVLCIAASARSSRAWVAWAGAALLLAAVLQGVLFHYFHLELPRAELVAVMMYATIAASIGWIARMPGVAAKDSPLAEVFWTASFITSLAAAAWLLWLTPTHSAAFVAGYSLWLALVWIEIALATNWLPVWSLFQVALSASAAFGAISLLEQWDSYRDLPHPWLDPSTWQAAGIAVACVNLGWTALRLFFGAVPASNEPVENWRVRGQRLLALPSLSFDRVSTAGLVVLLVVLGTIAVAPGAMQELAPRTIPATPAAAAARSLPPIANFELLGIAHESAMGWGSWALLGVMVVLLLAILRERASLGWLLSLVIVTAVACPLLACYWESEVAVASALRWILAAFMLVASVPIWWRDKWSEFANRWGWSAVGPRENVAGSVRDLVFFLALGPVLVMAVAVGFLALQRSPQLGQFTNESTSLAIVFGIALLVAAVLWQWAARGVRYHEGAPLARPAWPRATAGLIVVLGTAPILSLLLYHVGIGLKQSPIVGPNPDSAFVRMGLAVSYATPILLTAVTLVGYAIRERSSGFALAGGLVLNLGATAAYLLAISKGGLVFDAVQWIRLAQLNAAVASCYLLAWVGAVVGTARRRATAAALPNDFEFQIQTALAPALWGLALGWTWWSIAWHPTYLPPLQLADVWGWLSLGVTCASVHAALWAGQSRVSMLGISALATALVVFAAVLISPWDQGNWLSYHTLLIGHILIASGLTAVAWYADRRAAATLAETTSPDTAPEAAPSAVGPLWIIVQGLIVLALSTGEVGYHPWWPVGGFAFLGAALLPAMAWVFQRRRYLYLAAPAINVAGLLTWHALDRELEFTNFVYLNVLLLALPVVAWWFVESRRIGLRLFKAALEMPPLHRVATRLAVAVLAVMVGAGVLGDATREQILARSPEALHWWALAATLVAAVTCLWDAKARDSVAQLYFLGIVACGMLLDEYDLDRERLLWLGTIVTASYALATSYLWSRRRGLLEIADALRIPRGPEAEFAGLAWLVPCNLFLVAAVVFMTGLVELTNHDLWLRLSASQATLTQVVSVALLARGDRRGLLQMIALVVGAIGVAMFGWAFLEVGSTLNLLNALVVLAAALAAVAALYGFGLTKLLPDSSDWLAPAWRLTPWLASLSALSLVSILAVEILEFVEHHEVRIALPALIAVGATLAALALAALAAAVLPGRDPLGLTEKGRTLYVYAAEILLALLFVHLRLTLPWLFTGVFQQYWPLIVMGLSFLGVGFAEYCRRRNLPVLAQPLENTGALLPVLPVLGFWAVPNDIHFSLVLLLVGLLYAGLSIARRSFGFGVLAALAANGGLWYFLNQREGFGILAHPQVWLIPPAVCVLAAAYLNRRQLSETQMTTIRYLTSMTIYLSSTADIFLNGVAQAPWLPLVLAALSILGVLAGIMLRVQAFLFLGTTFLVMALFTIIYHAAVDLHQTWIWWASIIVAGFMVFALFAVFEKKRQEVLEVLEKIKQWEA